MTRDPVAVAADAFWVTWPRRLQRRLPSSWGFVGDAPFLIALPPLAVLLPLLTAGAAFGVGAMQAGYDTVYTESIALMAVVIALGCFSTQLGLLALCGFAVGEFFVAQSSWTFTPRFGALGEPFSSGLLGNLGRVRLPMLITYLLLSVPAVVVPRTARNLVVAVGQRRRLPVSLTWAIATGLSVVVVWIGIRTWAAAAPTLVRPRFTWLGRNSLPTVEAIQPLQGQAATLVAAGVAAALARQLLVGWSLLDGQRQDALRHRLAVALQRTDGDAPLRREVGPVRRLVGDAAAALAATLTMAGILERGWLWAFAFGLMLTVRLLRSEVIGGPPVRRWKELTARLPAAARLIALWVLARLVTDALADGVIRSYTGMALFVIGGVVGVFVLFPGVPATRHDPQGPPAAAPS